MISVNTASRGRQLLLYSVARARFSGVITPRRRGGLARHAAGSSRESGIRTRLFSMLTAEGYEIRTRRFSVTDPSQEHEPECGRHSEREAAVTPLAVQANAHRHQHRAVEHRAGMAHLLVAHIHGVVAGGKLRSLSGQCARSGPEVRLLQRAMFCEVGEDGADRRGSFDAVDDPCRASAAHAGGHVEIEDTLEALCPRHRPAGLVEHAVPGSRLGRPRVGRRPLSPPMASAAYGGWGLAQRLRWNRVTRARW